MRIAHLSDLHLLSLAGVGPSRFLNKRLTGYANLRLKRGSIHRATLVRQIAREITRRDVDHVVITGDLTNLALESEFDLAREVIESDLGLDPSRVSIVPGNHDLYTRGAETSLRFARYFAPYLVSDLPLLSVSTPAGPFPYVKLRGPVAIIGLSSAVSRLPFVASGRLGKSQLHALERILAHDEVRRRTPVILVHHPVHNPSSRIKTMMEGLSDAPTLCHLLRNVPRGLILHGHLHRRIDQPVVTDVGTLSSVGATSASLVHASPARAAGFNVYEVDETGALGRIEAFVVDPDHGGFESRAIPSEATVH
jgi:3',5'-cyclic AMP phosphodiesterase CpdA